MTTVIEAIARQEGFYVIGSRPQRNANPGDLLWGPEAKFLGAYKGDPTYAVFYTAEIGWDALRRWLSVPAKFDAQRNLVGGYMGATLQQAIYRFAPPESNNSAEYLANVCEWTGLTPQTVLTAELLV